MFEKIRQSYRGESYIRAELDFGLHITTGNVLWLVPYWELLISVGFVPVGCGLCQTRCVGTARKFGRMPCWTGWARGGGLGSAQWLGGIITTLDIKGIREEFI